MVLILPRVANLLYKKSDNEIWQYFSGETSLIDFRILNLDPFKIESNGKFYIFTSNKDFVCTDEIEYVLLTSRKPTKNEFNEGKINIKRWLKHPAFINKTPDEVRNTWKDKFNFIKENEYEGIKGLRAPQIGALYSILAHIQNPEDKAIVVMPTGTGKTETMLSTLIANVCDKLLVSVPSDSLRTQISDKFITLGLLKDFGIVDSSCLNPIVGTINSGFECLSDLNEFIAKCNVVVSTMDILTELKNQEKNLLTESFSHFFVDEAHHSEAITWKNLIDRFNKEKIFLFTATPFRNDGKSLQGKIIFNFSLKKAQEQKYYKQINYLPIREYNKKLADEKIAFKAVEQLRSDIAQGFNHIIMARCVNKNRAIEVFEYYKDYVEFNPIMIYTGIAGLNKKIEAIKKGNHSIIVCVNMLGEGFDLANLKIAAIHDERQSLPITLQFVGRFTRTSYHELGNASFITNIAYPPIHEELDQLYSKNSDWNLLLPRLSENATQKEIDIKMFLDRFNDIEESKVPFQEINPAMSTLIFNNNSTTWNHGNWKNGIPNIENYDYEFSRNNGRDTIVIILGKVEKVEWGNFETVQNLQWDIVIVHWDLRPNINRVFLNTSLKNFSANALMDAIFGSDNTTQITGMNVFRIFHDVNRLSLYNVGTRKGIGQDITFQSYYGKGVQDGIKGLEQGTLIKNNIFGIGYKNGEKISLGCSVKGKIWSYQRGNLDELIKWSRTIGDIVENETINPNVVLQHTLAIEKISQRPNLMPMYIDWHPAMYEYSENRYQISISGNRCDISNTELNLFQASVDQNLKFTLNTHESSIQFEIRIGIDQETEISYFKIIQISLVDCSIQYGNTNENIALFFQKFPPTIWFVDGSQLFENNLYVKLKIQPDVIPLENIMTDNWQGVSLEKESQDIAPYIQDSIQYYFINKIRNDYQIIYDDDGTGEIADIVGINDSDNVIDIHLYHLKYAVGGEVNNRIDNFYQVCGQAQKSLRWKHRDGREFFNHLFRRKIKTLAGNSCSRIVKGTEADLEDLASQAKYTKPMNFHIYIVQPSLSKADASSDILLLLGNVHHYLATVGNIELKVYCNE